MSETRLRKCYFAVLSPKGSSWEEVEVEALDCQRAGVAAMSWYVDENGGAVPPTHVRVWSSRDHYRQAGVPYYEVTMIPCWDNGSHFRLLTDEIWDGVEVSA